MKKFEGILFCTDLDGTLFTDNKEVSKQNLDAIEYFKSEGGLFTFITGRMAQTSKELCNIIKPNAPYGCINGGGIYDHIQDKYLWTKALPREALSLVKEVFEKMPDMGIQINTASNIYFCNDNSAMVFFRKVSGVPFLLRNYNEINEPILKVVFAHEDENRLALLADMLKFQPNAGDFDFIRSERIFYEILPKGSSKGSLLIKLAELLNIDPNKTIAVGDYNNDISMIKAAKTGFAVENAVEEAKAAADYITVSNNNHAIAAIIDALDHGDFKL